MQLFNSAIYSKESQIRIKAIEQTRKKEADREDRNERSKITKHLRNLNTQAGRSSTGLVTTAPIDHQLYVDGIRFRVVNGGGKLLRIFGRIYMQLRVPAYTSKMDLIPHDLPLSRPISVASNSTGVRTAISTGQAW